MNTQRFFLLIIVLLFSLFGCDSQRSNLLLPDNIFSIFSQNEQPPPMESSEITNIETSFQQNLLPILSTKCAYVGCHIAGGPKNLDLSTYQSFIKGGDSGPIFIPGNAQGSPIIGEIVSGRMPLGGPRLTNTEIQLFRDWINNQTVTADRPVNESPQTRIPESTDLTISFEHDLSPILNARCAYAGCHDMPEDPMVSISAHIKVSLGVERMVLYSDRATPEKATLSKKSSQEGCPLAVLH